MIDNVLLLGTETTITLAGSTNSRAVISMIFYNSHSSSVDITLYAYSNGGSAAALTTILSAYTIPAGDTFIWSTDDKFTLSPLAKISGLASVASKVAVCVNYMDFS